ncbi:MAG: DnaB-like helicase C-terminal domain-containing protein [Acidobacteriaceae bacterium]
MRKSMADIEFERGLPASLEAERTILGAILLDNEAYAETAETVRSADFMLTAHQVVFACMGEMIDGGSVVDLVTLSEELSRRKRIEAVGGVAWLASLTEGLPRRLSIREYVRIVKEKAALRQVISVCALAVTRCADQSEDAEQIYAELERDVLEIRAGGAKSGDSSIVSAIIPLLDRLQKEHSRTRDLLGLPTGIRCFDLVTRGFQDGEITQFGARSGVGKSAAMIQAAVENCERGTPVLIFSLEMTREQILRRILSVRSGVPFPRVRDPKWASAQDMEAIRRASEDVAEWPLHVVDTSGITIERLVATARLAIRRHGVRLVAVDYAQIVAADGRDERLRVAAVSRGLTRLAKDEGVPVLVLSQLARAEKANASRRPAMSDLRESSQLENDAHCIALLHRKWDEDEGRLSSDAELIIAKQRSGETGVFPLTLDRRTLTFADAPQSAQPTLEGAREWSA